MWDIAEITSKLIDTGRDYYNYFPTVEFKRLFDQPNKEAFSLLLQLQSGYSRLNSYRHKLGQVPSDKCGCGQTETAGADPGFLEGGFKSIKRGFVCNIVPGFS